MRVLTRAFPRALTIALASTALLVPGLDSASAASVPSTMGQGTPTLSAGSSSGPATAAASRRTTSIRFLDFDHTRPWKLYAYVQGQVIASKHGQRGALKSVRVRLYRKLATQSRFHYLDRASTGSRPFPRFTFKTRAVGNADYRVVFRGNTGYRPSRATSRVLVQRSMRSNLEDGSGSFHGFVKPKWNRRAVYLEKRACPSCPYRKVKTMRSGRHGYFRFVVPAPRSGRWWWRASTPATSRFIWSYTSIYTTQLR